METENNLHASIPNALLAKVEMAASAEHISVDEWVRSAMEQHLRAQVTTQSHAEAFRPATELTFEERRGHLKKLLESVAGNTVVLPNEAMTRQAVYEDRGL